MKLTERTNDRQTRTSKYPVHSVTTDDDGWARLDLPFGVDLFDIDVPGIGYGGTGRIIRREGQQLKIEPPALVPYARITGQLPAELRSPDSTLKLRSGGFDEGVEVTLSEDGKFSAEVRAGEYRLLLLRGKQRIAYSEVEIDAYAGDESVAGRLKKVVETKTERDDPGNDDPEQAEPAAKQGPWVHGVVRDMAGKPAADAKVYALATFHGGLRMYEALSTAATDDAGRYSLPGELGLSSFSAIVIAHQPGKPPALAWITHREPRWARFAKGEVPPAFKPPQRDFVLADQGGELTVRVLHQGMPAAGVSVLLAYESAHLREQWAAGSGDRDLRETIDQLLNPVASADRDGVAVFEQLPPGTYSVYAAQGDKTTVRSLSRDSRLGGQKISIGSAHGISVRSGEEHTFSLSVAPPPQPVSFSLLRHDGEQLQRERTPFDFSRVNSSGRSSTALMLKEGIASFGFDDVGLFSASLKYRDPPPQQIPLRIPYYAGDAVVAVSTLLSDVPTIQLTADERSGTTAWVRVLDQEGRSLKAAVDITNEARQVQASGQIVDDDGVRFPGLAPWGYIARATIPGQTRVALSYDGTTLPDDRDLVDRVDILGEPFAAQDRGLHEITLRVEPVGYIRGVLRAPPGRKPADFRVFPEQVDMLRGASATYLAESGEFVAGPFRAGQVRLRVQAQPTIRMVGMLRVAVKGGEISTATVDAPDFSAEETPGVAMIGLGGISSLSGNASVKGSVVLSDGLTPAYGAKVLILQPGSWRPLSSGMAAADGSISPRWQWRFGNDDGSSQEMPDRLTVVAWLPGRCGPLIAPLEADAKEPLKLKLPPSMRLAGVVTIAGRAHNGEGSIRVYAQPEDQGYLGSQFPIDTTASADGSFDLAGLVSGKYRVQAALDNVWLSASKLLTVTNEMPPGKLLLDILEPGGPVVVRVERAGKPGLGEKLKVERPPGPLANLLWPEHFELDGAAQAYIPALESGKHVLRVGKSSATVEVPPLAESGGKPVNEILRLEP